MDSLMIGEIIFFAVYSIFGIILCVKKLYEIKETRLKTKLMASSVEALIKSKGSITISLEENPSIGGQ